MNTVLILSLVALTVAGLALIHETRLRQLAHGMLCYVMQSLHRRNTSQGSVRDNT